MPSSRPPSEPAIPFDARLAFKGQLFDIYQWELESFDGRATVFERAKRPDTVYVIPINPGNEVTLLRQQRSDRGQQASGLIAGRIDADEVPEEAARRALVEEAGILAGELVLWEAFQFSPRFDWAIFIFIARNYELTADRSPDIAGSLDLISLSCGDFLNLVASDNFVDRELALLILRKAWDLERPISPGTLFGAT